MKLNWLSRLFLKGLFLIGRGLLSLRYDIQVKGLTEIGLLAKKGKGILFLPNHPAEIDPVIVMALLGPRFFPRTVIVEHFYHLKGLKWILDLARVLPIPSMDEKANKWRGKEIAKKYQEVKESLDRGENFIIYPSGRLKLTGLELLGGASFVHNFVQENPDIPIVLIRTTGLWGSSFSKALTGSSPDFGKVLKSHIKTVLKNGVFFVPKRRVLVDFSVAQEDFPRHENRIAFNRYLEDWYNQYPKKGAEPFSLVSYSRWKEELPAISKPLSEENREEEKLNIPVSIQEEVCKYLAELSGFPQNEINAQMNLSHDLGMDSLDIAQIHVFLDLRYDKSNIRPGSIQTVQDVLKGAIGRLSEAASSEDEESRVFRWPKENKRKPLQAPEGQTLQEAFLLSCDRMGPLIACADALSGALSYKKLKLAAWILSEEMKSRPGSHIGILLPSSVGVYLTIFSVLLAGKIPVMLNWTAGAKALDHACKVASLQTVITSKRFLDRLEMENLGNLEEMLVFLEDMKQSISWKHKLKGLFFNFLPVSFLMKQRGLKLQPSAPAVILFTSGTETLPKAVPLTHTNILENQRAAYSCTDLKKEDVLYGVLPPFHSFGFSVTGIFPILTGLKVYYAPDPTDSFGMARDIENKKLTLLCCAPSFIRALFAVADPKQLETLRLIVSGAEKTPKELFDYVKENCKNAMMIEGYGITECSPIVTLHRIGSELKGVGRPLPGQEICIIDPVSGEKLPSGSEGEICISGPNVFEGYMQHPADPFVWMDGKKWYRSGDRGSLDEEGNLFLKDRIKRFIKIGAEMVPLGGVEEELLHAAKEQMWYTAPYEGPPLALVANEKNTEKSELILFSTFEVSKEKVNQALKESGWGRIVKIAEVRVIHEIPLTGTGKTHYRKLEEQLGKIS
jgi:acyl-CoA synthetase (AMP-forming)/AMP-acid ligase II/1-acyl-sn-glycerol-3-phosphate acyltransferase/acyl carrier protein